MVVSDLAQTINDLPQDYNLDCVVSPGFYGDRGYGLEFLKDHKNRRVILRVNA